MPSEYEEEEESAGNAKDWIEHRMWVVKSINGLAALMQQNNAMLNSVKSDVAQVDLKVSNQQKQIDGIKNTAIWLAGLIGGVITIAVNFIMQAFPKSGK